ncbi:unnamed protein product [Darwinula stevensoni]|uniref:Phosphate transporter n=1 Tax=Darwinula stevensoni TaxID=69355 RepID=A0A7R9A5L5_9CRUS|nr:unnamed protein product [Darwinula stevensoni]CAG0885524.1 unnamed protein product [Darwinula stevensoni]
MGEGDRSEGDLQEISMPLNDEAKRIQNEESRKGEETAERRKTKEDGKKDLQESPEEKLFSFVQVLTAMCASFVHGGNDVSNAIGPIVGMWFIYQTGMLTSVADPPLWILLFGGIGISCGLTIWGRRVMRTIGKKLTLITPSRQERNPKWRTRPY